VSHCDGIEQLCVVPQSHFTPPPFPIHYILWYRVLNVHPPPPRHPIFTHCHNDFLMTLFFHTPPPTPPFHTWIYRWFTVKSRDSRLNFYEGPIPVSEFVNCEEGGKLGVESSQSRASAGSTCLSVGKVDFSMVYGKYRHFKLVPGVDIPKYRYLSGTIFYQEIFCVFANKLFLHVCQ
jgi:hypothetical protein